MDVQSCGQWVFSLCCCPHFLVSSSSTRPATRPNSAFFRWSTKGDWQILASLGLKVLAASSLSAFWMAWKNWSCLLQNFHEHLQEQTAKPSENAIWICSKKAGDVDFLLLSWDQTTHGPEWIANADHAIWWPNWNCSMIPWVVPPSQDAIVTTRIVTFLVEDPYKPSFATVTGRGDNPNDTNYSSYK